MSMNYSEVAPDDLCLDLTNPRFGLTTAAEETDALRILYNTADLRELWNSIAERGYERFEPLVATLENGKLIVLEGNRRLAAVKLLLNPDLLGASVAKRIPSIDAAKLATCDVLPVLIVDNRDEASGYIGFKHVNGPTRWSSLAKARFGVHFFEKLDQSSAPEQRMQSLSRQLGDSRGLIIRLLVAYKVIVQAINLGIFDDLEIDEESIEFSHLYTLINNPDSRKFLGLTKAPLNEGLIVDNPVPSDSEQNLRELMEWLYGSKSIIKSQGTDRPKLQRVLASSDGLAELRTTGNLGSAAAVAGLGSEDWLESIAKLQALSLKINADLAVVIGELSEEQLNQARTLLGRTEIHLKQIKSAFSEV